MVDKGWKFCRIYYLAETPHCSRPGSQLWVGRVELYAPRLDILKGFSLDRDLHRNYIAQARAFDTPGEWVQYYRYHKDRLEECFNVTTDKTPLTDWWPCPREDNKPQGTVMLT